jgi:hypothetical protein
MEGEKTIDFLWVREGIKEFSMSALGERGRIATMTNDWRRPRVVLDSITRRVCVHTGIKRRARRDRHTW